MTVNIADLTPSGDDCYVSALSEKAMRPAKGEAAAQMSREIAVRAAAAGALAGISEKTAQRCGRCRGVGHNHASCREVGRFPIGGLWIPTCMYIVLRLLSKSCAVMRSFGWLLPSPETEGKALAVAFSNFAVKWGKNYVCMHVL